MRHHLRRARFRAERPEKERALGEYRLISAPNAVYERKKNGGLSLRQTMRFTCGNQRPIGGNHKPAHLLQGAFEKQLFVSVTKKQALTTTEGEDRRRFGDNWVVPSMENLVQDNTGPENKVRLLLDGANGVRVNSRIRTRDQDRTRAASDVKRILRAGAQRAPVAWVPGSCFGTLAVTDKRAVWLDAWCTQLLVESVVQARRFHKGAGTAAFVFGSLRIRHVVLRTFAAVCESGAIRPLHLSVLAAVRFPPIWKEAGGLMHRQGTRSELEVWWSRPDDQGKIVKKLFARFAEQLT